MYFRQRLTRSVWRSKSKKGECTKKRKWRKKENRLYTKSFSLLFLQTVGKQFLFISGTTFVPAYLVVKRPNLIKFISFEKSAKVKFNEPLTIIFSFQYSNIYLSSREKEREKAFNSIYYPPRKKWPFDEEKTRESWLWKKWTKMKRRRRRETYYHLFTCDDYYP